MNVSRGMFLRSVCLAAIGAGVDARSLLGEVSTADTGPQTTTPPGEPRGPFRIADATAAAFLPHLNTSFAVRSADGGRVQVVLAKVSERPATKHVEQFSVEFHALGNVALADGIHAVRHPALGAFDLYIAPIGGAKRQRVYEACFSRRVS